MALRLETIGTDVMGQTYLTEMKRGGDILVTTEDLAGGKQPTRTRVYCTAEAWKSFEHNIRWQRPA